MGVKDRIGEDGYNKFGTHMLISKYNNANDIEVYFPDYNHTKHTSYKHFKRGSVKCEFDREVCNVGFIGIGDYNGKSNRRSYEVWRGMLRRCYKNPGNSRNIKYKDIAVCDEWHNFQNFATWYKENYYEIEEEKMCLDKDILVKGNKVYSPETCIFVPGFINNIFTKTDGKRGEYPIGVHMSKNGKFKAQYQNKKHVLGLGTFDTVEEAFSTYKQAKEEYIKQVADEYKDRIPKRLYDALYRYEVEITD